MPASRRAHASGLAAALLATVLAAAPALAQESQQVPGTSPGALETMKRTIQAQGDISPQTKAALSGSPDAARTISQQVPAAQQQPPAQQSPGRKAIYGDIIIYK